MGFQISIFRLFENSYKIVILTKTKMFSSVLILVTQRSTGAKEPWGIYGHYIFTKDSLGMMGWSV